MSMFGATMGLRFTHDDRANLDAIAAGLKAAGMPAHVSKMDYLRAAFMIAAAATAEGRDLTPIAQAFE